jgi:hypothetical protein
MKPNAHYINIAFILDRSGSMKSCQQAAIAGFNQFLADQQTSVSEKLDAAASLADIVSEEDRKSREPESPKS